MDNSSNTGRGAARRVILIGVLGLWVAALFLTAITVPGGPSLSGLDVLARGWRALGTGVYAWLANPLFLTAIALAGFRAYRLAGAVSGAGCVLAFTSYAAGIMARRAGTVVPDPSFAVGFYCWLAAQLVLFASTCWWALGRSILQKTKISRHRANWD